MKNIKKVVAINAILFAALFGLISLNKEFLRHTLNNTGFQKVFTDCFPNFIAAFLISLLSVSAVLTRNTKHGRFIVYVCALVVFLILMIEEIKPMWGANEYYDSNDIIASGVGSFLTILTFELLTLFEKKFKQRNE
jgi:predicted neutral ceramidase superfamily lipid hydrolase